MARKKIKNPDAFDIIIAGGGLSGLAMAARMAGSGMRILVVERETESRLTAPTFDGRTTALAYGSKAILESCGVWDAIEPHTCPIEDIRVADQHAPQIVDFESSHMGDMPFGYIVDNRPFREAMFARVGKAANITLRCGTSITALENGNDAVRLTLDDATTVTAPLLIAADGRKSICRNAIGIKARGWSYNQTALVTVVAHETPHNNLAVENFYPDGPFAILPMTENRSSIVWTEKHTTAVTLSELEEPAFLRLLAERGGAYLGATKLAGPRKLYPLTFMLADELWKDRVVLIGEAAHGMHPIAGQGFNLSVRDIGVLGQLIETAYQQDADWGNAALLADYASKRHFDHFAFMTATDVLEKLFSNNVVPLKWARRFGLGMVQRLPIAKNFFGKMAMGLLA